ncbi:unnamed protein product [Mycena citricolor]|uniref:WD40 repeat-like protein n=1 Tax=Mycena citricolor TaxID=2018698 RepID=A0AAD2Q4J7_9AGAR|nr:unnamed protein product [Mycena citricolor]
MTATLSSKAAAAERHRHLLSKKWNTKDFDRVNVLGNDGSYGHSGCVNALSWARDGALLLTAGDDRTVQIWSMDPSLEHDYPYICRGVLKTGHRANIFNAKMLPHSSKIATVSADAQVRLHDMGDLSVSAPISISDGRYSCTQTLRCHEQRVKRIVTEDSPHLFLTVAEDGCIRQHDIRTAHSCGDACPPPLLDIGFELSTLSLSPLTPYQFVAAGEAPYGYLFDRRQISRLSMAERARSLRMGVTNCIRRLGRQEGTRKRHNDHITGSRMSILNGHEVLLSYSGDAVYLYSTRDDCVRQDDSYMSGVPVVPPRQCFRGARNVDTIKDGKQLVNFLGSQEQFVTSGSDDGNIFIWKKDGGLHSILEGDSSIVNVIEGHPHLPLFAASGLDSTVKLFGPTSSPSVFSRTADAEDIIETNERRTASGHLRHIDIMTMLYTATASNASPDNNGQCQHQ